MELAGKVAFITGASRGIGRAVALAMAADGADIILNYYLEQSEAEAVAEDVRKLGRRVVTVEADVSDHEALDRAVDRGVAELGSLDIAVANAAYSDRELFYEADLKGFHRTVDVTMWGAFYTLRAAARVMIAQNRGGAIVLVSSPLAEVAMPRSMAYNMSKAAVDQMARTAAIELVDHRIRVNIVHPGWVDTPGERKFASDDKLREAAPKLPWKRLAQPEEIARMIAFLCDPKSDYVTGSTFRIDGGYTLPWWLKLL
jgi:glucose 1-dehydrogenase